MARQVNSDAAVTRSRLIGAAAGLFAEHGMKGTSVRDMEWVRMTFIHCTSAVKVCTFQILSYFSDSVLNDINTF